MKLPLCPPQSNLKSYTAGNIFNCKSILLLPQDFDCRLTDLAARVYGLQNIGESGITAEMLPADVLSTVDGVAEDFDRYFVPHSWFQKQKLHSSE